MPYAFTEFRGLVNRFPNPFSDVDPNVVYVCAMVAELAYYHVSQNEIDSDKRAHLIPCEAYREIVRSGSANTIEIALRDGEFESFVVTDRGSVAVGLRVAKFLFIGFRGTQFLFDWKINLDARRESDLELSHPYFYRYPYLADRLHPGFAEESVRISLKIRDAMLSRGMKGLDRVFFTGHSLGGAIAAISEILLKDGPSTSITFGAPRFCNYATYWNWPGKSPLQIRNSGDIFPLVPPRRMGYSDPPRILDTDGVELLEQSRDKKFRKLFGSATYFAACRFEPHSMKIYRSKVGSRSAATLSSADLTPANKLRRSDLGKP